MLQRFSTNIVDRVTANVRAAINEETADLRVQLYPHDGSSLADKIHAIHHEVKAMRQGLHDVKVRLDAIHPTGEIPVTNQGL